MLILTRKTQETINIGDDIEITVLGIRGGQVRIGVKAPHNVQVHREEIYNRIKEGNRETLRTPKKEQNKDSQKHFNL